MNLEQYIGVVKEGTYPVRVNKVEFTHAKSSNDPMLVFTGHFTDLGVDQKWRYMLTPTNLWRLQRDLNAAEVLREGDAYSDDFTVLAQEIESDLSDRTVLVEVTPQAGSQFSNFEIKGVSLAS